MCVHVGMSCVLCNVAGGGGVAVGGVTDGVTVTGVCMADVADVDVAGAVIVMNEKLRAACCPHFSVPVLDGQGC